jgi:hypothetical protein
VLGSLVNAYISLGKVESALSTAAREQAVNDRLTDSNFRMQDQPRIGAVYALVGRYADALPILEAIVDELAQSGRHAVAERGLPANPATR